MQQCDKVKPVDEKKIQTFINDYNNYVDLNKIAAAAKRYIDAKNKQIRLFPSPQRRTRLAYANNLLEFAKNRSKFMSDINNKLLGINALPNKDKLTRVSRELGNNITDMKSFVEKVICNKAKIIANLKAQKAIEESKKPIINVDISKLSQPELIDKTGLKNKSKTTDLQKPVKGLSNEPGKTGDNKSKIEKSDENKGITNEDQKVTGPVIGNM